MLSALLLFLMAASLRADDCALKRAVNWHQWSVATKAGFLYW
jgi:hypothetical protein